MKADDIAAYAGAVLTNLGAKGALNALPDGVYVTDTDRRVLFWNKAAEAITGWTSQDVVGTHCRDNILNHTDKDGNPLCGEEQCPLHRSIITGYPLADPVLVYALQRNGRRTPVEVLVSPLRDENGTVIGGVELFRDAAVLHEDMRSAGVIQRHVLDCEVPDGGPISIRTRHTTADLVGGDFLRAARLGPTRYAAMVADVMGHGISSALFTMQMRVMWDDLESMLGYPEAFMGNLNGRLRKFVSRDDYFATACHVVVDTAAQRLGCAAAGHPAPILRRADGRFEELQAGGPALGMIEAATYPETTVPFAAGDSLLLYTDGAIEVTDSEGRELGVEGLIRLCAELAPSGLPDLAALEGAILHYSSNIHLPDDVTFVSLSG